ncbi:MAG: cytochrome c biogenesis protein CcdA [Thermoanaerobaculia bacterium]
MQLNGVRLLGLLLAGSILQAPFQAQAQAGADPSASVIAPRLVADSDRLVPGHPFRLAFVAEVKSGWHINSHKPKEDYLIPTEVSVQPSPGLTLDSPAYPKHLERKFVFSETPLFVYEGSTTFSIAGRVDEKAAAGPRTLSASIEYQPCNDQQCLAPTKVTATLTIEVAKTGAASKPANEGIFPNSGKGSTPKAAGPGTGGDLFGGKSLPLILGLVFLSGLALNLTPCVFPLIPITMSFFLKQSDGKVGKTLGFASLFVLGLCFTYTVLGVFAAITGSLFGSWLQEPVVLVVISAVVLAMALSMFGLFEIQAPHFITDRTGAKSGAMGALSMGLFLGFVAAPCVGPFIVALLTYVGKKGSVPLGAGLFFTLALGLGFPYLVLGTASGSLRKLPRSGEWMIAVKRFFGFAMIGLAVYFLRPVLPERLYELGVALPLLVGGVYFLFFEKSGRTLAWFRGLRIAFALLLLAGGTVFALPERKGAHASELAFTPYSDAALASAREAGKPVMIDFYADWCLPCKELDKHTFNDARVVDAGKDWVFLKADLTHDKDPAVSALRKKWAIAGVPTLLFLTPEGQERGERVVGFEKPELFVTRFQN